MWGSRKQSAPDAYRLLPPTIIEMDYLNFWAIRIRGAMPRQVITNSTPRMKNNNRFDL